MEFPPEVLKQSISSLLKLQEIDGQLFKLNAEEKAPAEDYVKAQNALLEAQKNFRAADRALKEADRDRRASELRSLTLEQDVKKAETKRREVRNTKEEFAAGKEFDSFQRKLAETKKMLETQTEATKQRTVVRDEKQQALTDAEAKIKELDAARAERIKAIQAERDALQAKRQEHISHVNEEIFSLYERVQRIRKGNGVALVKAGVCQGCFVSIPPHTRMRLEKVDELITCSSCSRILFPEDEINTQGNAA